MAGSLKGRLIDPGLPSDLIYRLRTSAPYIAIHRALKAGHRTGSVRIVFVYLGLAFASHALFNVQDVPVGVPEVSKRSCRG